MLERHFKETRMAEVKSDRRQALDLAIAQIERQFGKGAVMRLGSGAPLEEVAVIPTGTLSLDAALGIGGLPPRPGTEIYRPGASRQTTPALHPGAEGPRPGGVAPALDAQHSPGLIYCN